MDRRDFLLTGVAAGTAAALRNTAALGAQSGAPSDRLRFGFLGMGARAHQLADALLVLPNVEVVSLCDAYAGRAERGRARTGGKATLATDYRRILDDRSIDAVFIVTPDHWHRRMALDALAAGKDVYIEKPMTYSVGEGLEIVKAVDAQGRVLEVGSQGVSSSEFARAREIVKSGRLGQVTLVRAVNQRNTASGAWLYPIPPDAGPATVDWDQFIGPAPKRAFSAERFFRWRCYWDYSGGLATDLFVHLVSAIHFILDADMPAQIVASGSTHRWKDTHEVPDTIHAVLTYPQGFTVTLGCTLNSQSGSGSGLEILGTKGALRFGSNGFEFIADQPHEDNRWVVRSWSAERERAYYDDPKVQAVEAPDTWPQQTRSAGERWINTGEDDTVAHIRAFIESMRSRRQPVEDARFGHRAAACAHMINHAVRERRVVEWDATRQTMKSE
jgi:predicted dehydrogenase